MARILLTLLPLTGHLHPVLALAEALERRGHEIAWAVHRNELGDRLPAGSTFFPLDEGRVRPEPASGQVRGLDSVRLFFEDYAMPLTEQSLLPLERAVREFEPDLIAADYQMPAGALVARQCAVPWVSLVTTTASILKMSPAVHEWVAAQYMDLQRRYLPAPRVAEFPDFSPDGVAVFSIEALAGTPEARVDAPLTFVGPARGGKRQEVSFPWEWLRPGCQRLLASLGTVSRDLDPRFFETIIEAMRDLPQIQAILVAPPALSVGAPDNVLVRDYVPQIDLLDHVDAVICHAGHNTVCEALLKGVPLIVSPIRDDQPVIARRVVESGTGLFLRHGKATPAAARAAIESILSTPSLVENARRLQSAMQATPGADGAVDLIESVLTARHPSVATTA